MVYALSMAKRKKKEDDFAVNAFRIYQEAKDQVVPKPEPKPKKTFDPVALGHLGGLKGGKARAERLTPKQRSDIAKRAAEARWGRGGDKVNSLCYARKRCDEGE